MRYLGIFTNTDDSEDPITRISGNTRVDRILPAERTLIKGEIRNESTFSALKINFYSSLRETQAIKLGTGECLEVLNQPCERLQIETADQQYGEYSYQFQIIAADNEEDLQILLRYSNIKKKLQNLIKRQFYPEIGTFTTNSMIGDLFRRRSLNLANYPDLYIKNLNGGGAAELVSSTVLEVSHDTVAGSYAAASAYSGVHNSYFDPIVNIRRIDLDSIIYSIGFDYDTGFEAGLLWTTAGTPPVERTAGTKQFGFYISPSSETWRLYIDTIVQQYDIDTGVEVDQSPSIMTNFGLEATPAGSKLVSRILEGTYSITFEDERTFSLAPTEALFPNFYTFNQTRISGARRGIGSFGWSAAAK